MGRAGERSVGRETVAEASRSASQFVKYGDCIALQCSGDLENYIGVEG